MKGSRWNRGKKSFFDKIAVGYIVLTLVIAGLLFFVLSQNLVSIKYDQTLIISDQIIAMMDDFLKSKIDGVYSIQQKLYLDKEKWDYLTDKLMYPENEKKNTALGQQEINITISHTIFEIDEDFKGLFLGGGKSGNILWCGSNMNAIENDFFQKYSLSQKDNRLSSIELLSAKNASSPGNAFSLFLINPVINMEQLDEQIGVLALYFDAMSLQQSYKDLKKYMKGDIYVLDREGALLYDDKATYHYRMIFPWKSSSTGKPGKLNWEA